MLIFASIAYDCIKGVVSRRGQVPIYIKGDKRDRRDGIFAFILFVGLAFAQQMIIPGSYYPVLYWIAFVGVCILSLLSGSIVVLKQIDYVNAHKRTEAIIIGILSAPIAVLLVMYLCNLGYNTDSYQLAVLFFVMYVLLGFIPSDKKKTLSQIDALINRVLYNNEKVDEKTILEELEVYMVGLRYGKYLSATKLVELKPLVNTLVNYSDGLIQDLENGNSAGVEAILKVGNEVFKDTQRQYKTLMREVNSKYGDEMNKEKSLEHIIAVGKIAEQAMRFWSIAQTTMKLDYAYKTEHIMAAYQQTIGTTEMKQLIERELVGKEKELG